MPYSYIPLGLTLAQDMSWERAPCRHFSLVSCGWFHFSSLPHAKLFVAFLVGSEAGQIGFRGRWIPESLPGVIPMTPNVSRPSAARAGLHGSHGASLGSSRRRRKPIGWSGARWHGSGVDPRPSPRCRSDLLHAALQAWCSECWQLSDIWCLARMEEAKGAVVFFTAYHRLGRPSTRPPTASELGVKSFPSGSCSQTWGHTSKLQLLGGDLAEQPPNLYAESVHKNWPPVERSTVCSTTPSRTLLLVCNSGLLSWTMRAGWLQWPNCSPSRGVEVQA